MSIPLPYEIPGTQKPGSLEEAVQGNLDALAFAGDRSAQYLYLTGATSSASTSTTFVTTAPAITVPVAGTYLVHVQAQTDGPCVVSASGAGFTASDNEGFYTPVGQTGHGMFQAALTTGTLNLAFRSTDGGSRTLLRPRIALIPVSV